MARILGAVPVLFAFDEELGQGAVRVQPIRRLLIVDRQIVHHRLLSDGRDLRLSEFRQEGAKKALVVA